MDCKFTETNAVESLITAGQQLGALSGTNSNPLINQYLGEVMEHVGGQSLPRATQFYRQAANGFLQHNLEKALELLLRAYRLDPDHCQYEQSLGQMYAGFGDSRNSVYHFKLAMRCGAKVQQFLPEYAKAVHAVLQNATHSADMQFDWAEAMEIYGDKEQAGRHYAVAGRIFLDAHSPFDAMECAEKGEGSSAIAFFHFIFFFFFSSSWFGQPFFFFFSFAAVKFNPKVCDGLVLMADVFQAENFLSEAQRYRRIAIDTSDCSPEVIEKLKKKL